MSKVVDSVQEIRLDIPTIHIDNQVVEVIVYLFATVPAALSDWVQLRSDSGENQAEIKEIINK